jgi:uncharacterized membrane protein YdbT with pleckstrin-like domain
MSYVDRVLQPGEKVLARGRPHWIAYWRAIVCAILAIVIFMIPMRADNADITRYAAAFLFIVGLCFWIVALFHRWTTEIGVTDRRVIYKRGFIARQTAEMQMDKIESVLVDQSFMGRILDYGTLAIRGTGASIENLRRIADPIGIRNAITAR